MTEHEHDYRVDTFTLLSSNPPQRQAFCIEGSTTADNRWKPSEDCEKWKIYIPDANYPSSIVVATDMSTWPKYDEAKTHLYARHPGVQNLMRWLTPNPKLPDPQRFIADLCSDLADAVLAHVDDGPELTEGLRKLLEAKDCFVRASLPPED